MTYGNITDCSIEMLGNRLVDRVNVFKGTDGIQGPTLDSLQRLFGIQHGEVEVVLVDACMHYYTMHALGGDDSPLTDIPYLDADKLAAGGAPRFFWGMTDSGFTRVLYQEDFGIVSMALALDMNPKALYLTLKQLAIVHDVSKDIHKPYSTGLKPGSYGLDTDAYRDQIEGIIRSGWPQATSQAVDQATKIWYQRFSDCFSIARDFSASDSEEEVEADAHASMSSVELCLWRRLADSMPPTALT